MAFSFSSMPSFHFSPSRFEFKTTKLQPFFSKSFSSNSNPPLHLPISSKLNLYLNRNHLHRHNRSYFKFRASSSASSSSSSSSLSGNDTNLILFSSALTVTFAVANRVLYKLALVPMKDYPFFLAQFNTFGYVVIYFTILYIRYRAGIVTDEMLAIPKWRFLAIGFLEALGLVIGMSAGAVLPGPVIPILNQTFLVWQLMFSTLLLRRRYTVNQIAGCLLVASGVVLAIASGSNAGQMLSEVQLIWPVLMIVSCVFQAWASVIKEFVFIDSATRLKRKSLDIFVVNSFGSGFQALFVFLLLPFLSNLKGIPFVQLPSYLKRGAGCLLNFEADKLSCDGAPLLPVLYIITNLAFNISLLNVVKTSSAVVASLLVMLSVPISVYILSLPLPYLPEGTNLSSSFLLGCGILVCGLFLYNTSRPATARNSSEVD